MARFTTLDYTVFAAYLLGSALLGFVFARKKQESVKEFLLAGRSMGPVMVGIAVLSAMFSGISYLGAPSEVYAHDASYTLVGLSFFIATPITTAIFIPFFYRAKFFTAYHYLEERFSVGVRTLASAMFITRVLLWLALAIYAPALALEQVTGLPLWFMIVVTGSLATFYAAKGGIKAVIWIDAIQFIVLFGGQLLIFIVAFWHIPGGVGGVYDIAREGGKLTVDLSLDPMVRVTLWGLVLGQAFHALVQMATDQVAVQRYMTATSLKTAQRGLWARLWMTLPVTALFYLSGVVLYAYYQSQNLDPLASGAIRKADQILPYFVVHALPAGMGGLLISAVFSASMNVCSSGINALTTAALMDFYKRLWRPDVSETEQLRLARWMTIGFGMLVMVLAFVVERMGTLVEGSVKMMALTGGPLLGLFFLGMLSKRANAKGAIAGWLVGVAVLLPICFATKVSFLWHACIGCVVTYVAGFVASALFAAETKSLEGLTVATRYVPEE
ncbi:MAG: sodium/solute symporter [Verrucomicrobia bacterium]|nr:sodium/solute symporter [Verrucomicrobiota bacterium]